MFNHDCLVVESLSLAGLHLAGVLGYWKFGSQSDIIQFLGVTMDLRNVRSRHIALA